jgi:hypothetical protein
VKKPTPFDRAYRLAWEFLMCVVVIGSCFVFGMYWAVRWGIEDGLRAGLGIVQMR